MEQVIRRQDLVEADLRCLMCGRLIGQLAGLVWRDARGPRTARSSVSWTAFRAATPGVPEVTLTGRDRFQCRDCGGLAGMEEVSVSVVHDSTPAWEPCPIHRDRQPRRGRRPKGCECGEPRLAA
jgi:hypothetical protein